MLKNVLILAFWIFAFLISLPLFSRAVGKSPTAIAASPGFAIVVTLAPMGLLLYIYRVAPFSVPNFVERIRPWESNQTIYKTTGVLTFGKILKRSPLRILNSRVYLRRSPKSPDNALQHVQEAETVHFWGFFAALPYILYSAIERWWLPLFLAVVTLLIVILYPYFHLRYTRYRLVRLMDRNGSKLAA